MDVLDLSPYWTTPPRGGGQLRVHNLNRALSASCRVTQWSFRPTLNDLSNGWRLRREIQVTGTYREIQVLSPLALAGAWIADKRRLTPDAWQGRLLSTVPRMSLRKAVQEADVIQVEHPWLFDYVARRKPPRTPLVLNTHNVEASLLASRPDPPPSPRGLARVQEIEQRAVKSASGILACSPEDRDALEAIRGKADVVLAPNGVDVDRFVPVPEERREAAKRALGLEGRTVAVFAGGVHYPNLDAAGFLKGLAEELEPRGITVVIVGRAAPAESMGRGYRAAGFVDDVMPWFSAADFALNPLMAGGGSSLKMLEFLAMGLPTITTPVGARGTGLRDGVHALVRERKEFVEALDALRKDDALRARLAREGRALAKERFTWSGISRGIIQLYEVLLRG